MRSSRALFRGLGWALAALLVVAAPAIAQTGTWNAADAYYDPQKMAEQKRLLQEESGGGTNLFLQADRLEIQSNEGAPLLLWDAQGWYGGDLDKLWIKTEGDYALEGKSLEEAEIQALYSRAITPYFDLQAGVRHDVEPHPSKTHGVAGIQGLAPYWFEIDAAAFFSEDGDVSARVEAEYDLLLTQRLILQPRAEFDLAVQDVAEIGVGAGLSSAEIGLRLRYEIIRQAAPYIGISWARKVGRTADFARAGGEDVEAVSIVAGFRLWF